MGNSIKTVLLFGLLTGLALGVGEYLGGRNGMILAFVLVVGMNFFSYWYSDKIVLKMYRAQEVSESQAPQLYSIVRSLTEKASLPMPKVYIIPGNAPNAFATGRNPDHAAVAVTHGLLNVLNTQEIEGVLAHELAHIGHRDTLTGTIAATLAGGISMLARIAGWSMLFFGGRADDNGNAFTALAMIILTPIIALILQLAISRSREFAADAKAAKYTGSPEGLASALRKLDAYAKRSAPAAVSSASAAISHLFIVNPFSGKQVSKLFSTHPPIEERIDRLMKNQPTF